MVALQQSTGTFIADTIPCQSAMSSSELSDLTSTISTDDDIEPAPVSKGKLEHYFKNGSSATQKTPQVKRRRAPSPPHEYVLADNPDIAVSPDGYQKKLRICLRDSLSIGNIADDSDAQFICMFRSRFSDAFLKSLPHYGPQDIEYGVVGSVPGEQVERLLCALLGLVLNRKKEVEYVHLGPHMHLLQNVYSEGLLLALTGYSLI